MQKNQLTIGALMGLVVIFVLVGFALTLNPFRDKDPVLVKKAMCMSNVKQQGLALVMYAADYDDLFPKSDEWMDASLPYTKNEYMFHCPAISHANKDQYGYAMNCQLSNVWTADIDGPDRTVLVFESMILDRNACSNLVGYPNPSRHKMNAVSFADGHGKAEQSLAKYR